MIFLVVILSLAVLGLTIAVVRLRKIANHTVQYNASIEQDNRILADANIKLKNENLELCNLRQSYISANQQELRYLDDLKERVHTQDNILRSLTASSDNVKRNADEQAEALRQARVAAENELKNIRDAQAKALTEEAEQRRKAQDEEFQKRSDELNKKLEEDTEYKRKALETELQTQAIVLIKKIEEQQSKLDSLEAKQAAYIRAKQREEEMAAQKDYYRLILDDQDLQEVKMLRNIQVSFIKKEAIDKLIWDVYFKQAYDTLMSHLFKNNIKTSGIYKITNLSNEQAYIGQSVDMKERFRQHIKSGLSSSAPSNKLYQQMKKFGLENFTFEILEEVERAKLNERETYWIDFYKTKEYGLNSTIGGA